MKELDGLDVLIRRRGSKVIAGIPQLGLYTTGDDVSSALASLDRKKEDFAAGLADAGEFDRFEWRDPFIRRNDRAGEGLGRFALKVMIVVAVVAAALLTSSFVITNRAQEVARSLKPGGHAFWSRLEQAIDRAADPSSDLPQETKQKLLADIRAIVRRWRPFLTEAAQELSKPSANNSPPQDAPRQDSAPQASRTGQ